MAEYINKESILDKIGSLPLNWEYGKAVDDIYKMVEAEPTVQIGRCDECANRHSSEFCECRDNNDFCSDFISEGQ